MPQRTFTTTSRSGGMGGSWTPPPPQQQTQRTGSGYGAEVQARTTTKTTNTFNNSSAGGYKGFQQNAQYRNFATDSYVPTERYSKNSNAKTQYRGNGQQRSNANTNTARTARTATGTTRTMGTGANVATMGAAGAAMGAGMAAMQGGDPVEGATRTAAFMMGSTAGAAFMGAAMMTAGFATGGFGFVVVTTFGGAMMGYGASEMAGYFYNAGKQKLGFKDNNYDTSEVVVQSYRAGFGGEAGNTPGKYYQFWWSKSDRWGSASGNLNSFNTFIPPLSVTYQPFSAWGENILRVVVTGSNTTTGGNSGISFLVDGNFNYNWVRVDGTSEEMDKMQGTKPPIDALPPIKQQNNYTTNNYNYYNYSGSKEDYHQHDGYKSAKKNSYFGKDKNQQLTSSSEKNNKDSSKSQNQNKNDYKRRQDYYFDDGSHYAMTEQANGALFFERMDGGKRDQGTDQKHRDQALKHYRETYQNNKTNATNNSSKGYGQNANSFNNGSTGQTYQKQLDGENLSSNNSSASQFLNNSEGSATDSSGLTGNSALSINKRNNAMAIALLSTTPSSQNINRSSTSGGSTPVLKSTKPTQSTAGTHTENVINNQNNQAIKNLDPIVNPDIKPSPIESKNNDIIQNQNQNYIELLEKQNNVTTMLATGVGLTYFASQFTSLANQIGNNPPSPCQWTADRTTVLNNQTNANTQLTTANTTLGVVTNTQLVGINSTVTATNTTVNTINTGVTGLINTIGTATSTATNTLFGFVTKSYKALYLDRVYNAMSFLMQVHNTAMLSRNVGESLGYLLSNTLSIFGIKDENDQPLDFGQILGNSVENFIKNIVGEDTYNGASMQWKRLSAIYSAVANIYDLILQNLSGIAEGIQIVGNYTGEIGNALKKGGVVLENAYEWMEDNFRIKTGRLSTIERINEGLESVENTASELTEVTEIWTEGRESITEINSQVNEIKEKMNENIAEKLEAENLAKTASASPVIENADLITTEPE